MQVDMLWNKEHLDARNQIIGEGLFISKGIELWLIVTVDIAH